jgi:diaminohydroxyphosphoribosylaminopyrimidine deaminase/5-amino-6-(5-phosphoribosylamino)uracil reductase
MPRMSSRDPWRALLAASRGDESTAVAQGLGLDSDQGWGWSAPWSDASSEPAVEAALDLWSLYLPFLPTPDSTRSCIVGHLGQSLDGFIATRSGDACFVTGPENIRHLHRMRALADAVVVGAGTVALDDPKLTTRLVPGPSPVRVVLDPDARVPSDRQLFTDSCAPTLVCRCPGRAGAGDYGDAELVEVPEASGSAAGVDLSAVTDALRARGLYRLFVEGGGVTVSRFLQQGLLDRLQITVAPLIIGEGRRGVTLPASDRLADALRPAHRVYRMGEDVLFDCDLRVDRSSDAGLG